MRRKFQRSREFRRLKEVRAVLTGSSVNVVVVDLSKRSAFLATLGTSLTPVSKRGRFGVPAVSLGISALSIF